MIKIYESDTIGKQRDLVGYLSDALTCVVKEERNGEFELQMTYPVTGKWYEHLKLRNIIGAKPNPYANEQLFRIYNITKAINCVVTVNAEHISYGARGLPVSPFTASNVVTALDQLKSKCVFDWCPFTFWTDKNTEGTMTVTQPSSLRSLMGGTEGSILDIYGGEYEFNNYDVKLWNSRGQNRGVTIRYGKNLTDLEQEENCANVFTGVYPYWYSEDEGLVELSEKVIYAKGNYNFVRIATLDLSNEWVDKPTEEQLRARAEVYMTDNDIGVPKVSLTVSFVQLAQTKEYSTIKLLEEVHLCDTVTVVFPELGVNATAKCISYEYDVLSEKYTTLELGDSRSNFADTVSGISSNLDSANKKIDSLPTKNYLENAVDLATNQITGGLGGYVVIRDSSGGKKPDEILIMNTPDIKTATQVWRWNKNGLGYSNKGYAGPYTTAMTQDGQIVANFITTGTMLANIIRGGTLLLGGDTNGLLQVQDQDGNLAVQIDYSGVQSRNETYEYGPMQMDIKKSSIRFYATLADGFGEISRIAHSSPASGHDAYALRLQSLQNKVQIGTANSVRMIVSEPPIYGLSNNQEVLLTENENTWIARGLLIGGYARTKYYRFSTMDGYLINSDNNLNICTSNGTGFYVSGNLYCSGTKNRVVDTEDYGKVAMNAFETPGAHFGDFGSGVIGKDSKIYVYFDPIYVETVDNSHKYQVFVNGIGKDVRVVEKQTDYFVVYGEEGTEFDWMVVAKQRGYQADRMEVFDSEPDNSYNMADSEELDRMNDECEIPITDYNNYGETEEYEDTAEASAEGYLKNYEKEIEIQ